MRLPAHRKPQAGTYVTGEVHIRLLTKAATPSHFVETLVINHSLRKAILGVYGHYREFNIRHYSVAFLAYAMTAPDIFFSRLVM